MTSRPRLFDTRYFWKTYTEKSPQNLEKLRALLGLYQQRFVSTITLYEVYKLSLASEGKEVAQLRCMTIRKDMQVANVDAETAEEAARISHRMRVPMADALIIASAKLLGAECITDDEHFSQVKTKWIS